MHLHVAESVGPAGPERRRTVVETVEQEPATSSSLPFDRHVPLAAIAGPTYLTAQTVIQQVAYSLSDSLYTYSPDTFDLDIAVRHWSADGSSNAHGSVPTVSAMQLRHGAGSVALGYLYAPDFDATKRHLPQSVIASSAGLKYLRPALHQLSRSSPTANPVVLHVAAVDYVGRARPSLVTDYVASMDLAEELELGLVCSLSAYDAQHMALFSTLLAHLMPTVHTYDGVVTARETIRIVDALDKRGVKRVEQAVRKLLARPPARRSAPHAQIHQLFDAFNGELGTDYAPFEYHGHEHATHVVVAFGTVESSLLSQVVDARAKSGARVGLVNVRVFRPFLEEDFVHLLPTTTQSLTVLGQVTDSEAAADRATRSNLYRSVLAAVFFAHKWARPLPVAEVKYARDQQWMPAMAERLVGSLGAKSTRPQQALSEISDHTLPDEARVSIFDSSIIRAYSFWDVDDSKALELPPIIGRLMSTDASKNIAMKSAYDNLVQGGIVRTDLRESKRTVDAPYPVEDADLVYVGEEQLLERYDVIGGVKKGGAILLRCPGLKDDEVEKRFSPRVRRQLAERPTRLYIVDPQSSTVVQDHTKLEPYLIQLAFLRVAGADSLKTGWDKMATSQRALEGGDVLVTLVQELDAIVRSIPIPDSWRSLEVDGGYPRLPRTVAISSFTAFDKGEDQPPALLQKWETAAKRLAFKEAYQTSSALRPDLAVKTWTVRVKENRRLTPVAYDRNIFHIEFDLGDSGLKYDIGESLGIHAENEAQQVRDFITFYGWDADEIVEVPSREDPTVLEMRTVYQSLMQNVDIFGRPPKRFYEALAGFAEDEKERRELLTLGRPEGAGEFQRRSEVDTVTYADILREFPSAHPSFHDLVPIVSPLKRREYSVASSQKVTPRSVALMIVVVNWVDRQGRERFGQATRYLRHLRVGEVVTVSVKGSVMKLPPQSTQPLIMAGLGTGLAPFRAFVQYRAWQKAQGIPIGAVLLYMGSRHQREEYLYGEEWEAYQDAGVITLLGRAFSRDQPQKIYIQDRMRQTLDDIVQSYLNDHGSFYLCGPTWPVPDVTEVLQEAIVQHASREGITRKIDARKEIEVLKDDLRYVLEVY
ncbi:MAG: hypothetical protein M1838_000670 [Thelocarpon superellum]|nr:MAG: hypothetical protein M1838_000670 [Thelocarpon superellum]